MFGHVGNPAIKWFFVRGGPNAGCHFFPKIPYVLGREKSVNLHATKTVLETPVSPMLFFASMGQPFQVLNELIIDGLTIMLSDASVGAYVFEEVSECRTVAKWKTPETFPGHGFSKLEWPPIGC